MLLLSPLAYASNDDGTNLCAERCARLPNDLPGRQLCLRVHCGNSPSTAAVASATTAVAKTTTTDQLRQDHDHDVSNEERNAVDGVVAERDAGNRLESQRFKRFAVAALEKTSQSKRTGNFIRIGKSVDKNPDQEGFPFAQDGILDSRVSQSNSLLDNPNAEALDRTFSVAANEDNAPFDEPRSGAIDGAFPVESNELLSNTAPLARHLSTSEAGPSAVRRYRMGNFQRIGRSSAADFGGSAPTKRSTCKRETESGKPVASGLQMAADYPGEEDRNWKGVGVKRGGKVGFVRIGKRNDDDAFQKRVFVIGRNDVARGFGGSQRFGGGRDLARIGELMGVKRRPFRSVGFVRIGRAGGGADGGTIRGEGGAPSVWSGAGVDGVEAGRELNDEMGGTLQRMSMGFVGIGREGRGAGGGAGRDEEMGGTLKRGSTGFVRIGKSSTSENRDDVNEIPAIKRGFVRIG